MTTVLLTGFEPFAGDATNPSGDAVRLVGEAWTGGERLVTAVLPVAFARAAERMRELIDAHSPDVILATGLAGGRAVVTPERVAINLTDARIPDNDGARPIDEPSMPGAPAAAFATLPVKAIAAALVDAGIPSAVSYTAGTFVCNHVMFTALDAVADRPGGACGLRPPPVVHRGGACRRTVPADVRHRAGDRHRHPHEHRHDPRSDARGQGRVARAVRISADVVVSPILGKMRLMLCW
ncbi:MAG: hypothetical protein LKI24_17710 [Acidipropionibacterium sp.]|jgi:pyroglutamyl-peptidase|nr:hypothetical protein [Acidipropionibacterium sp.]